VDDVNLAIDETAAVTTATNRTADTAEAATETAAEATEAATDVVTEEAAAEVAEEVAEEVAGDVSITDLLTVDGFDLDKVQTLLDDSDLGALQKTALTTGLNSVKDNPELLGDVLTKIREALGL
jgi:hypothetical protein